MRRTGLLSLVAPAFILLIGFVSAARVPSNGKHDMRGAEDAGPRAQLSAAGSHGYTAAALRDSVGSLPGWGPVTGFNMFSGYITVDEAAQRNLFYVLTESSRDPENDPLLLWLNGGPGCSSLGGGFMSELGPWLPRPGGNMLQENVYAWNRVANVLFVESPAFVGFSYSLRPQDAIVGDARTATDLRAFLLRFMERFPHFASRPLYLSGESYAGHYVPGLAWEIVKGNRAAPSPSLSAGWLPLRGLLVGNPWTDAAIDNYGAVDMWWSHALISDQVAEGIKANCNFSRIGPLDAHPTPHANLCDKFCNMAMGELGPINIYHIYADVCTPPRVSGPAAALAAALAKGQQQQQQRLHDVGGSGAGLHQGLGVFAAAQLHARVQSRLEEARRRERSVGDEEGTEAYDPCVDDQVEAYLNLPEVQRALHANQTHIIPGRWTDCTRKISYSREDLLSSMLPVWRSLLAAGQEQGLRFLVFSGDVDGIVPVIGTRRWVASLGLAEVSGWRPWYPALAYCDKEGGGAWAGRDDRSEQVGGYVIEYALPASTLQDRRSLPGVTSAEGGSSKAADSEAAATHLMSSSASGTSKPRSVGGMVFATVRGAGHMVPYVQPGRALHLAASFMEGVAL